MVELTEDMVVARTRVSDMANVKKLNCWGVDLTDISVVRRMSRLEIVSLSLNNITSLSDFQFCSSLQELFVRKNKIQNLKEVLWLRDLSKLRNLWLADNPCAEENARYRQMVIRNLPQLQKLDNVAITSEERDKAVRSGWVLAEDSKQSGQGLKKASNECLSSYKTNPLYQNQMHNQTKEMDNFRMLEVDRSIENAVDWKKSVKVDTFKEKELNIYKGIQTHVPYWEPIIEDSREIRRYSGDWFSPPNRVGYCYSKQFSSQKLVKEQIISGNQRPKNKNSNMLSAILCLVKEMDVPSLQMVEMAIRCRTEDMKE